MEEIKEKIREILDTELYTDSDSYVWSKDDVINELTALFQSQLAELWGKICKYPDNPNKEAIINMDDLKQLFIEAGMKE